ncbi:MAG: ArsR family transcriptional regulator [Chitinispirillaceae bacterium]|nr:ArsR family transcriptional regulator [Chitinispirillaceae bacterium]
MNTKTTNIEPHVLAQFALIGKALSSPSRLQILDLLCQAERTVEGLAKEASLGVANTSQHLQMLRQAGIVSSRRDGNFIIYRIAGTDICRLWKAVQTVGHKQLREIEKTVSAFLTDPHDLDVLDSDDVLRRVATGEIVLLDVRPEEEYTHAHIRGAQSVPLEKLRTHLRNLPRDKKIVAYCRGPYCVLSLDAVKLLRKKGLKAYRMAEGMSGSNRMKVERGREIRG